MATRGQPVNPAFQISVDGPAIADRCICVQTPTFYSEQLLARMHICTGRSVFNSATFGCPLHQWQLSHTITEDNYSLYLHYQSDTFPGLKMRCIAVHAEFSLTNSQGHLVMRRDFKRAFTGRGSWGFKQMIHMLELRQDPYVSADGLVLCSVRVNGLEGKAFTEDFEPLRVNGQLCDVTLVLEDGQIEAHRVILAARSEYFAGLLMTSANPLETTEVEAAAESGGGGGGGEIKTRITIPERLQIMSPIIQFLYNGRCDDEDYEEGLYVQLYQAADLYGCERMRGVMASRLTSEVTLENVIERAKMAWDYDDEILKEALTPLIKENFVRLREREEFRELLDKGGYADMVLKLLDVTPPPLPPAPAAGAKINGVSTSAVAHSSQRYYH